MRRDAIPKVEIGDAVKLAVDRRDIWHGKAVMGIVFHVSQVGAGSVKVITVAGIIGSRLTIMNWCQLGLCLIKKASLI